MMRARWLSPPIDELHGRKVFRDCQTNSGECISTGDFVHLLPADPSLELYVGRIESMYEDESRLKCIQVRWFYRPRELQHDPPLPPLECEVYHTSYYDCQLLESVVGRCMIKHKRDYLRMKTRNVSKQASQDQVDLYACGYSYCAEAGLFAAIQEEDLAGSAANLPYVDSNENGSGEISHEDTAVVKQLANALLGVDRSVPREVARTDWTTAKRLPWVLNAKNAMTLEDLKQLLIDLESGLEIFKHQSGWRKSVQSITSFDALNNHIQYLKHNAQQKVDDMFKKPRQTQPDEQTRKRKALRLPRPGHLKWRATENGGQSDKEGSFKKIVTGSAYEIDHAYLPPSAPMDLKCLRVVMGSPSSYKKLSHEKQVVDEQIDDLWKSVEVMQEDVTMVLDSMGFSPTTLPMASSEPIPNNFLALLDKTLDEDGSAQSFESATERASKENILLFQRAAQVSSKGLGDHTTTELLSSMPKQVDTEAIAMPCASVEKQIISPKEEIEGCGFRVWKPEGSCVGPGARKLACFQSDNDNQVSVSRPVLA